MPNLIFYNFKNWLLNILYKLNILHKTIRVFVKYTFLKFDRGEAILE